MKTIQAIYEGGVFRPTGEVPLPEKTTVEFEPRVLDSSQGEFMTHAFEILSRSYETGRHDLAARHDEHQP